MVELITKVDATFDAKVLYLDDKRSLKFSLSYSGILFMLDGKANIKSVSDDAVISQGEMLFLPSASSYVLISEDIFYGIVIQIPEPERFCHHFFSALKLNTLLLSNDRLFPLVMTRHIELVITDLDNYLQDNLSDPIFLKIKTLEIFHFLSTTYSPELLARFFTPVLSPHYTFSQFVLENYRSVKTVDELAALSHYSRSGFQKQFQKIFGVPPYKWMVKRKMEEIYREISETSKPLKVIAEEAGFAGISQLSDFCRKRIGRSPGSIRCKK